MELSAAKDINLISRAGGLEMNALNDIKFSSLAGSVSVKILDDINDMFNFIFDHC